MLEASSVSTVTFSVVQIFDYEDRLFLSETHALSGAKYDIVFLKDKSIQRKFLAVFLTSVRGIPLRWS